MLPAMSGHSWLVWGVLSLCASVATLVGCLVLTRLGVIS